MMSWCVVCTCSSMSSGKISIGTSGIALPGGKADFPVAYRDKSRLSYYASLFNSIEINSTFKKLPRASTLTNWCTEVGNNFTFTIKLSKDFTHVKKQENITIDAAGFMQALEPIGNKKGCLLIQFPASTTANDSAYVATLLRTLHELDTNNHWRKAVEFRSDTWYTEATYNLLRRYNATLVLQDMPKSNNMHIQEAFSFCYFRYHGPKGDYRGSYTTAFLQQQAARMHALLTQGRDVYVYFNNTMGSAFDNAMYLQALLREMG